jgi:hypothetical protein
MATLRDLLLLLCLIGGCAGTVVGTIRRTVGDVMAGLLVVAVSVYGLFG